MGSWRAMLVAVTIQLLYVTEFSISTQCAPMQGCQENANDPYTQFSLGDPSTETMYYNSDTGERYLQYDNGDDGR